MDPTPRPPKSAFLGFLSAGLAAALAILAPARAETIVLENGNQIEGTIAEQTDAEITVDLKSGGRMTVKKRDVRQILRDDGTTVPIAPPIGGPVTTVPPANAFRKLGFAAACEAARIENKAVFVDFYSAGSGPCKLLDATTWKDAQVRIWLDEKTVALRIDAEKESALAAGYKVEAHPTLIFLKPDGTEVSRLVGFRSASRFLSDAEAILGAAASTQKRARPKESEPMARHEYGRALMAKDQPGKALEEFLWCWDRGLGSDPTYAEVRSLVLLEDIVELGKKHAAARQALADRRDSLEKAVRGGNAKEALDYAGLNRCLEETDRTLKIFTEMKENNPARGFLLPDLLDRLIEARRYEEILKSAETVGGWSGLIEKRMAEFRSIVEQSKEDPERGDAERQERARNRILAEGGACYEALLAVGKAKDAEGLADQLVTLHFSGAAFAALMDRAVRAENTAAARTLEERAIKSLPASDLAPVREAAAKIPAPEK